jgi:5-methylcytosine-specific restriction enzyme subunit McrC
MKGVTIFEFDVLAPAGEGFTKDQGLHAVPTEVFTWLEARCLSVADDERTAWLRIGQRRGRRVVQVTSYAGVIRAPGGYQIEVLPKIGKAMDGHVAEARQRLIEMLCCLEGFRHLRVDSANLKAARMPLWEVFVGEFLYSVERVVKRGLRSDYRGRQGNLRALRGKLLISAHLQHNLFRADRFYTEHDEFSTNRPENRLLHAALRRVLQLSMSPENQQLARELLFVFADIPVSRNAKLDLQQVRLDRGMTSYADALAWAKLILEEKSPLTGIGEYSAPSLLFPMEAVFEAYVSKHVARQVKRPLSLKPQARSRHLVLHQEHKWFQMKPDLLVCDGAECLLVLDAKWKLLDAQKVNGSEKYGLSQGDFYQLQAYGQSYLGGKGDVVLIYPRTSQFDQPLPEFRFSHAEGLRLWVLPFCLRSRSLLVPGSESAFTMFENPLGALR